jgi:hypothetical protein
LSNGFVLASLVHGQTSYKPLRILLHGQLYRLFHAQRPFRHSAQLQAIVSPK